MSSTGSPAEVPPATGRRLWIRTPWEAAYGTLDEVQAIPPREPQPWQVEPTSPWRPFTPRPNDDFEMAAATIARQRPCTGVQFW